jgi:thiamine-phosphate pyrophosphorylase
MLTHDLSAARRRRLAGARLYLVCPPLPDAPSSALDRLTELLAGAIAGGVDVVQLREKTRDDEGLVAVASAARTLCTRLGALLIVNDRPEVALAAGADGIHVGQDDMPAAEVRELVGPDLLIGLSTHSPAQIDGVDPGLVDYIGVGPIHETPTKPGRAAVGLELVRYAAANAPVPFFAIGGIDARNLAEVLAAGASRVCVLRALADADEPERAARELHMRLNDARASTTDEQRQQV